MVCKAIESHIKTCHLISKYEPYKVMIDPEKVLLLVGWWEGMLSPYFTKQERYFTVTEEIVLTRMGGIGFINKLHFTT